MKYKMLGSVLGPCILETSYQDTLLERIGWPRIVSTASSFATKANMQPQKELPAPVLCLAFLILVVVRSEQSANFWNRSLAALKPKP